MEQVGFLPTMMSLLVTSLDKSDQGESNDVEEKPRVLLTKKISERYKKLKNLRKESQKPGDI
jgi:hypothetical protein